MKYSIKITQSLGILFVYSSNAMAIVMKIDTKSNLKVNKLKFRYDFKKRLFKSVVIVC